MVQLSIEKEIYLFRIYILGVRVYQNIISEYSLLSSTQIPSIVNVSEPSTEPQRWFSIAYRKNCFEEIRVL